MPTVEVNVKSFEYGTKLVLSFVAEHAQHVQRLILLPTVDSVECSCGELTYSDKDQLLNLGEYHGTIGRHKVAINFANGVRLRAELKTPMYRQMVVAVTEEDTSRERKALNQLFGHRMGHFPVLESGQKSGIPLEFEPTHVYVDYQLGPSPFFWRQSL